MEIYRIRSGVKVHPCLLNAFGYCVRDAQCSTSAIVVRGPSKFFLQAVNAPCKCRANDMAQQSLRNIVDRECDEGNANVDQELMPTLEIVVYLH